MDNRILLSSCNLVSMKEYRFQCEMNSLNRELEEANHRLFNNEFLSTISYDEYTCSRCTDHKMCEYSFDAYNTNGDCLASK